MRQIPLPLVLAEEPCWEVDSKAALGLQLLQLIVSWKHKIGRLPAHDTTWIR